MADVMFVFVSEDAPQAYVLTDMFDAAGFSISATASDEALDECAAAVIIWSHAALTSRAFAATAASTLSCGKSRDCAAECASLVRSL